ncbi:MULTISPECIES: hypothetical protein [unclassified Amycolatopsis]|uniref:hypothetical protein n=1 Tax=unclassified Amycolatopsis TaxID=2618356 RepID=UPI001C69DB4D|nr:hypothetical protein [Amycolatopsis sp. DSM 110486]QYN18880.1 hypothetical protein K1T34_40230 [Amycolatopsis sp. DSM 110486]
MTGTPPEGTPEPGHNTGIRGHNVVNSVVYQDSIHYDVSPDSPPSKKYEVGVSYLREGCPSLARKLIADARANGYDGGQVRFHMMLALLSKRSYRDLDDEERQQLAALPQATHKLPADEWTRALVAVSAVLACYEDPSLDPVSARRKLHGVAAEQRQEITKHLDLVLTASLRESLWAETRQNAEVSRLAGGRLDRVWAYFHPIPAKPRARLVSPSTVSARDRVRAALGTLVAVGMLGYLGRTILSSGQALPILAYVLLVALGVVAARTGLEWRHLAGRLAAKQRAFSRFGARAYYDEPGFARSVDHEVRYYFGKFVPHGIEREAWLRESAGFQAALRNELVDIYRETRTEASRVHWLIRFHARDARKRWKHGTLFDYREQYRVRPVTQMSCVLSCVAVLAGSLYVGSVAVRIEILPNAAAAVLAFAGAWAAVSGWGHILCERRRISDQERERERIFAARKDEYRRWSQKLDNTRPSEEEMEDWLSYDRIMVLDKALSHYKLAWRDVLAYAFLQTPGDHSKRARVRNGPWRYSKYDLRLFLITVDGVRECMAELDFERVRFGDEARTNYRFDAVSSVHVEITDELRHALELTLMNGQPRQIRVIDDQVGVGEGEDPKKMADLNLDNAGFKHTLHILEGIAAEGKGWIDRDPDIRAQRRAGVPGGA